MKKWFGYFLKILLTLIGLLLAAIIFFGVQAALRENKTRQEAAPPTGRFVQAGDVELFIQEMGPENGQVILFIHGSGAWSEFWRDAMTPLAEAGYHCIAIDIPPFGFSERPSTPTFGNADQAKRIVALMNELNIEHFILLGHSFGGGATVETALMIPDRIDALILVDVGGLNLNLQPVPENQPPSALEIFMNTRGVRTPILATTVTNPLLTKTLLSAMMVDPADATDEAIAILQQQLVLEDATHALGEWIKYVVTVKETSLTTDPANYQTLDMPAFIIWGDSDTIVPLSDGDYLNSILPNSELVVMEGVNHIPHVEDLERFTELVLGFLNELPR